MIRALFAYLFLFAATAASADEIKLAVTTSFHNSGLSDVLLPAIKEDTGIAVQILVVGTGQALRLGKAGDVDAVLVHSKQAEDAFVAEGHAPHRREVMYNDFVLIGPAADPADITGATSALDALAKIQAKRALFVSRGDDSGTHKKERSLWGGASATETFSSDWYREVGAGMGAALNVASGLNAYIMSDRASWLKFGNKGDLALLYAGDPDLFNQYAYLPVSSDRHGHVNAGAAKQLEGWLTSERARALIDGYRLNGEPLFSFNAK